jgi:peptidyl-tRNA hydrolase, PTH1 family
VGRPESTDPDVVSSYVLSRFRESDEAVRALIHGAADEAELLVERITTATAPAEQTD